jgi:hypothetical protein
VDSTDEKHAKIVLSKRYLTITSLQKSFCETHFLVLEYIFWMLLSGAGKKGDWARRGGGQAKASKVRLGLETC